jgi:hypothetical protein
MVAWAAFTVFELMVYASPRVRDCVRSVFPDCVVIRILLGEKKAGA